MEATYPEADNRRLVILQERTGARALAEPAFRETVLDHLVNLSHIHRIGGYKKALRHIRSKMPRPVQVRSGDCGEILATEYIEQFTPYRVPVKRLRWKDDRDVAMRGDDVLALRKAVTKWHVLKAEVKSRESLAAAVVREAVASLSRHAGRPNPCSLSFIESRLRDEGRHDEADVIGGLQARTPRDGEIEHLIFTLSGNDPCAHLKSQLVASSAWKRHLVGCVITDHQAFIKKVFDSIVAGK